MKSALTRLKHPARRVKDVALAVCLGLGLLLAAVCAPRAMSEEEIETPTCECMTRLSSATRNPLVRAPAPLAVRPQGRAIGRGVQTRHCNNEQSKHNGCGSYLLI